MAKLSLKLDDVLQVLNDFRDQIIAGDAIGRVSEVKDAIEIVEEAQSVIQDLAKAASHLETLAFEAGRA